MEEDDGKIMMDLVDKLCDHLPNDRIKLFIDNGFDQWETVTYIKGPELIQLGFNSQQVIIIMVAINSNACNFKLPEVFSEEQIKQVLQMARESDEKRLQSIYKEEQQFQRQQKQGNRQHEKGQRQQSSNQPIEIGIKQYPEKMLCQSLMSKCVPGKSTSSKTVQKTPLNKITLLQMQKNQITQLPQQQLRKIPLIQNLYLANNHIYIIEGLSTLNRIKILRLQNNLIKRIQNLESLVNLQRLTLSQNYLQKIQNLDNNRMLNFLDVSSQKHKYEVKFDQKTFASLAYCLERFQCNSNCVRNIDPLRHLAVVQSISLKNNQLQEVSELTAALNQMQRIKQIDFRGNPITKVHKYRDYIVILSKSLEQLDDKKILPKQRQYLVKLYSLKHAKQQKQHTGGNNKKVVDKNLNVDLHVAKVADHQLGHPPKYVHGGDLRGNIPYTNTKVVRK